MCLQATFELLKEMSDSGVGPTGDTFNTLMDAAIECGDPEAALRLFAQMLDTGFTPDTVTYTTMIKVQHRRPTNLLVSHKRICFFTA